MKISRKISRYFMNTISPFIFRRESSLRRGRDRLARHAVRLRWTDGRTDGQTQCYHYGVHRETITTTADRALAI